MLPSCDLEIFFNCPRCTRFPFFTTTCSSAIGIMSEWGLETGLLCEVEEVRELMGEKGCGLIVAEAYAAAVDLRISMIFCVIWFGVPRQTHLPSVRSQTSSWQSHFDFRRALNFVGSILTRSESTKSTNKCSWRDLAGNILARLVTA